MPKSNDKIQNTGQNTVSIFLVSLFISLPLGIAYYLYCNADNTSLPIVSVFLGTFFAVFAACITISGCRNKEAAIVAVIFFVKFALTAYQALNKNLPLGGEDWGNYHSGAQALMTQYPNAFIMLFKSEKDLFTKLVTLIYMTFGAHTRQINLYVLASSFVAARYIFKTASLLTGGSYYSGVYSMLLFLVWPIDIVYSVTFLREMPIQMLMSISFYCYVVFIKSRRFIYLVAAFLCVGFASMMHSGVLGVLLIYIVFMTLHDRQSAKNIFAFKNLAVAAVVIIAVVASPLWDALSAKLGDISTVDALVERTQQFTEGDASTRYITDMPDSGIQLVLQLIPRALLFAVVPLPWMIHGLDTAISWAIDALPQLWIIYRLINLIRLSRHNKKIMLFSVIAVLCVAATYIVCGMGTTAYGNAIRHRTKIFPIVVVFIAGVYYHLKNEGDIKNAQNIHHHSGV